MFLSLPPLSLGGFPTLYTVEVKERLEDWTDETVMRTNTTDLNLALTDLKPLTRYDTRVRSQNFNGFSEFSQARQFNTFGVCMCMCGCLCVCACVCMCECECVCVCECECECVCGV